MTKAQLEQKTRRLPKRPSRLLRAALKDFKSVEKDPKYQISMGDWHRPIVPSDEEHRPGVCYVCLAGSMLARRCAFPRNVDVYNFAQGGLFSITALTGRLLAINFFREGYVRTGLKHLGVVKLPKGLRGTRRVLPYAPHAPEPFYAAMEKLANDLEKHGL